MDLRIGRFADWQIDRFPDCRLTDSRICRFGFGICRLAEWEVGVEMDSD